MGKTELVTNLILEKQNEIDRLIVICPTFYEQPVYEKLYPLIQQEKDVYEKNLNAGVFDIIREDLKSVRALCKEKGIP